MEKMIGSVQILCMGNIQISSKEKNFEDFLGCAQIKSLDLEDCDVQCGSIQEKTIYEPIEINCQGRVEIEFYQAATIQCQGHMDITCLADENNEKKIRIRDQKSNFPNDSRACKIPDTTLVSDPIDENSFGLTIKCAKSSKCRIATETEGAICQGPPTCEVTTLISRQDIQSDVAKEASKVKDVEVVTPKNSAIVEPPPPKSCANKAGAKCKGLQHLINKDITGKTGSVEKVVSEVIQGEISVEGRNSTNAAEEKEKDAEDKSAEKDAAGEAEKGVDGTEKGTDEAEKGATDEAAGITEVHKEDTVTEVSENKKKSESPTPTKEQSQKDVQLSCTKPCSSSDQSNVQIKRISCSFSPKTGCKGVDPNLESRPTQKSVSIQPIPIATKFENSVLPTYEFNCPGPIEAQLIGNIQLHYKQPLTINLNQCDCAGSQAFNKHVWEIKPNWGLFGVRCKGFMQLKCDNRLLIDCKGVTELQECKDVEVNFPVVCSN